jgi:hypothetical protein
LRDALYRENGIAPHTTMYVRSRYDASPQR